MQRCDGGAYFVAYFAGLKKLFGHLITFRSTCPFHHLVLLVKWVIVYSSCILVMLYLVAGAGLLNFIYLQSVL